MNAIENAPRSAEQGLVGASKDGGKLDAQDAQKLVRSSVLAALGQPAGAHGIRNPVAAIQSALSSPDSAGADPAANVLKKIDDGLQQAGNQLADRGLGQASIDAALARFRSDLATALDSAISSGTTPAAAPAQPSHSVDRFAAREVVQQKTALDILTTEGDRVSIRFRTKDVLTTSAAQSTSADGITTTSAGTSLISRGRLQVEVTGNLNDAELTAIGDLLTQVNALATTFFSGDVQAAFTAASHVGLDSDQIAGFHLNLTYSQTLRAAASFTPTRAATATPATGNTATSLGTTPQPTTLAPPIPVVENAATTSEVDAPTTALTPVPTGNPSAPDSSSASAPPDSARQTILSFIQDVLSKLGSVDGAGRLSFSLSWKVSLLVTALSSSGPPPGAVAANASSSTTKLLGDALQKVVA